ncbi:MAG: hypothetical protein K0S45_2850 [Nitrospira sp.]|jgi:hypothetical protein|nr:hypothetical protein [Nitrospira sp.]
MKVFLSYAHKQRLIAEEISVTLSVRDYKVFFDRSTLPPGQEYGLAIQKAVYTCNLFVFLISPESLRHGGYARTELGFAKNRWKNPSGKILPVMTRPTLDSRIDPYLRAVTILYPQGNVAEEVAASVTALLKYKGMDSVDVPPSEALQRERIATYKGLWLLTRVLPKWPRSKNVTYKDLGNLSRHLRDWYFNEGGGIFLSRMAYTGYAALQDSLTAILMEKHFGNISDEHYEAVRVLCSTLRNRLVQDIGSRQ